MNGERPDLLAESWEKGGVREPQRDASKKQWVSIRYSPEVLAYFKATGDGWQSRMDGVLKDYIAKRSRRAPSGA